MKKLLLVLILIAALALPVFAQGYVYGQQVDTLWTLNNQFGAPVSLQDFPQHIKFMVFWEPA